MHYYALSAILNHHQGVCLFEVCANRIRLSSSGQLASRCISHQKRPCAIELRMSFTGSSSPGSSPYLACSHSCETDCLEEWHQGPKESYNEREKTALRCMRAEIELSQPQFYGTSSLLGRIVLTGQFGLPNGVKSLMRRSPPVVLLRYPVG